MQMQLTLSGELDPDRLHQAVQTVVDRHPNLVAWFCDHFEEPVQIIPPPRWRPGATSTSVPALMLSATSRRRSSGCAPPNTSRSATLP
ncbi:condensation domain protein [Mycobacterium xenopi 3993]|nr:condensation domain protein [Mycobacterium xenopi 3993]